MPLQQLIQHLQPAAIFRRNGFYVIVLNNTPIKEAKEITLSLFPNLQCTIYDLSEYNKLVTEGNIFISTFCKPKNLLYANPHLSLPFLPSEKLAQTATIATENFRSGMQKAKAFYTGAVFYLATDQMALAAFMLHQSVELCLRTTIIAFTGHQTKTHTIEELMQHIKRCAPELSHFFKTNTEEENKLLNRLEKAYSHARYTNCYKIEPQDLQQLMQQVKSLHQAAEKHFEETIKDYTYFPAQP